MTSSLLDTPTRIQETSWIYEGEELLEQPQGYVGFVYLITNLINEKSKDTNKELKYRYIGMKTFDGGKPYNGYYGSQKELNDDVKKYGKENFKRDILFLCKTVDELEVKEIEEQEKRNVLEPGSGYYNRTIAYRKFNAIGMKHSEESRMKRSESTKGENHPRWGKTGENHPNYGKTHSDESKKKMSEVLKGENHPRAKLNEKDVLQILFLRFYRKVQQKKIAKAFNVSPNHVSSICTRIRWIDQYDAFFDMEPYKHLKPPKITTLINLS